MTTVVVVGIICRVCTTGGRQPHGRHPYSPLKPQRWFAWFVLSAPESVLDFHKRQTTTTKKSIYWLSVGWRRLCCLVRVSGLWRKRMSKMELNQELHQIQCFIHACTGSMEFKQQKQGQQKENRFHFDTWIDMHFFVMTVVIFCVLGAYSLSGEIHILQHTWLKAAGTHKHKYVGLSYTHVAVHVHISHHCCARCCRVFIEKEKITGALGLLSRPLTEPEQAITSYCTI